MQVQLARGDQILVVDLLVRCGLPRKDIRLPAATLSRPGFAQDFCDLSRHIEQLRTPTPFDQHRYQQMARIGVAEFAAPREHIASPDGARFARKLDEDPPCIETSRDLPGFASALDSRFFRRRALVRGRGTRGNQPGRSQRENQAHAA
ncbi:hypothetical protein [Qipengyuania citrea]|uniref:hypothetical protein n=1 Tax=Qipengyuania citrea TaxID=225971 RepID=UPI001E41D8FF|nr:hypothetical protein [Qipengyuania citrea]